MYVRKCVVDCNTPDIQLSRELEVSDIVLALYYVLCNSTLSTVHKALGL